MNSYLIATTALIATAVLIAATIAVPISSNSAYAVRNIAGNSQSQQANNDQRAAQAGLVNVGNANVDVGLQAFVNCAIGGILGQQC